ncbi:MAG TPA: toprim domain-containing protein [Jatrophihabitans sp.]|nr:toprim domain-containing protein [Jatrophihabitans sp.]
MTNYEGAITRDVAELLHARGIDRATAVTFRVGVVSNDAFPGHERYRGWLAIPYLDRNRQPLSLRFRCPHQHEHRDFGHGKYMSLTDEPVRVFNVGAIHQAQDTIHVTEGEFDAMVLNRIGLPAIAIPGVQAWAGHHRRMLAGFSRQWIWGDPDDAGADFNRKLTQQLRNAKAVRLRVGDVTDTYKAGGAQALLDLIGG